MAMAHLRSETGLRLRFVSLLFCDFQQVVLPRILQTNWISRECVPMEVLPDCTRKQHRFRPEWVIP